MNFLLNMENCALPCYCTRGYSVALLYFIFQFWDVEPICDHWVIGWSALAFRWYFDLGATQTKHHEQVPWDWRSIHIYQPHISDDTIYISGDFFDPEYLCCNRFLTCSTTTYTDIYSSSFHLFFWGFLPGMRPWRNWRSRRANVDLAFAIARSKQDLGWEKSAGKGGELRHFCWAHLMHLATGNREP